jgi:hypothetical protein
MERAINKILFSKNYGYAGRNSRETKVGAPALLVYCALSQLLGLHLLSPNYCLLILYCPLLKGLCHQFTIILKW